MKRIKNKIKIKIDLTKSEAEFLDNFGKRCEENGGECLSREEIIRATLKAIKNISVSGKNMSIF